MSGAVVGMLMCLTTTNKSYANIPYILEVTKLAGLYEGPSTKTKKIADADQGTFLLFVEQSKRGIWVKVKDSEGTMAWIPKGLTDFAQVEDARIGMDIVAKESKVAKEEREVPKEVPTADETTEAALPKKYRVASLYRLASKSSPSRERLGIRVDLSVRQMPMSDAKRVGQTAIAFEATFPSPRIEHEQDISGAIRFAGRTTVWGPFFYGPDFGYAVDKLERNYRHHLSLGLLGGATLGPLDFSARIGYDFFCRARAVIEIQMGFSF